MPFTSTRSGDGVLTLVLDTPGSAVNIFNHATARQTLEIMAGVSPGDTRAVVIRSAKPTSFINGVGLLLANASRSREDIDRAAGLVREAFAAFRRSPVPVIAAVQGTCWGCGVEFLLHTGYRIAADTYDTHFYMTELNDYLFVPVFRSTENLPRTVGLPAAIDMLLWGERWSARAAADRGLVNECVPVETFDSAVGEFVARVLDGKVPSCLPEHSARSRRVGEMTDADAVARARARIARLPAPYRKVYDDTLALLAEAAAGEVGPDHADRELTACADSSLAPEGRAAFGFFYLRQMASTIATADGRAADGVLRVSFEDAGDPGLHAWSEELRSRPLPAHEMLQSSAPEASARSASLIRFTSPNGSGSRSRSDYDSVICSFHLDSARPDSEIALWKLPGNRYVELSERAKGALARSPSLATYLLRVGYQVARTQGTDGHAFIGAAFVRAWLTAQLRFLLLGGSPGTLDASLRDHGYIRRARDFGASLTSESTRNALAPGLADTDHEGIAKALEILAAAASESPEEADPALVAAIDIELLAEALRAIDDRKAHVVFVDLAARELIDYPIQLRSLCSHMTPQVASATLQHAAGRPELLSPGTVERVESWIARGKSFYR